MDCTGEAKISLGFNLTPFFIYRICLFFFCERIYRAIFCQLISHNFSFVK